jgi:hypothetical protein
VLSCWRQEIRRRTFWSVYVFDKLSTCDRRKPPAIRDNICKVSLPSSEASFKGTVPPERTGTIDNYTQLHVAGVPELSPLARLVVVASVLSRCSEYVIQSSGTDLPPWDVRSRYQQVQSALLYLETELRFSLPVREAVERTPKTLPNSHEGAMIIISYAMYHVCHCLLSNASHLRQRTITSTIVPPLTFLKHAAEDNQTHAVALSRSLGYSSETGIAARCSFLSYCAIVSAVIHAVNCNSEQSDTRSQASDCLEVCSNFLAQNSAYWHNAGVMVSQIRFPKVEREAEKEHLEERYLIFRTSITLFYTSEVFHRNSIAMPAQRTRTIFNRHICTPRSWPISPTTAHFLARRVMALSRKLFRRHCTIRRNPNYDANQRARRSCKCNGVRI